MSNGIISGNLEQMTAARNALGAARMDLSSFGAEASGVSVPAQPAALAARIKAALADTSRAARGAERQLSSMQTDLAYRQLMFVLADAAGSFTPLRAAKPGSGKVAGEGFLADEVSAGLSGIQAALARYSKLFTTSISVVPRVERVIVQSTSFLIRHGRVIRVTVTAEVTRSFDETITTRTPFRGAEAAARAAKALGRLGHVNDLYSIANGLTTKGKDRPAAVAGAVGGMAGGRIGASGGAWAGAGFGGALGGPLGAVIGAGIGAGLGAYFGSELGKRTGELLGEGARWAVNTAKDGAKKVGSAAKDAANAAKKAGDAVGDAADKAGDAFGGAKKALGGLL